MIANANAAIRLLKSGAEIECGFSGYYIFPAPTNAKRRRLSSKVFREIEPMLTKKTQYTWGLTVNSQQEKLS